MESKPRQPLGEFLAEYKDALDTQKRKKRKSSVAQRPPTAPPSPVCLQTSSEEAAAINSPPPTPRKRVKKVKKAVRTLRFSEPADAEYGITPPKAKRKVSIPRGYLLFVFESGQAATSVSNFAALERMWAEVADEKDYALREEALLHQRASWFDEDFEE